MLVENIAELRDAFRQAKARKPFQVDAIVVLPEHIHALITLPAGEDNYSSRWRLIKSLYTQKLLKKGVPLAANGRGEYNLWQRRFWEHTIRDDEDMNNHINYIHYNPVKHGLVERAADWPHSGFHRYVHAGILPLDWIPKT
ncbi:transposase [Cellvibrio sp. KY-GH-1]|uniref:REP-associated tyrosine transposase n=1 Tax=Cellvibrio sp. KY-GH-1 TaxID=2303332 RepID=UPI002107F16D|nr:transposase [Cellvibrio sp. KY-GH-1]